MKIWHNLKRYKVITNAFSMLNQLKNTPTKIRASITTQFLKFQGFLKFGKFENYYFMYGVTSHAFSTLN